VGTENTLELQRVAGADGMAAPVEDISLSLAPGSGLALLGPARAGKSSLLRLIAGFGKLTQGRVLFNGHDLVRVPPHRRPFTLLGGQDALFPHMTVAANVAYGLKAHGLGRRETDQRVADVLDLVGARGLQAASPQGLNRGQRQKVALARALAIEPLVLLLDEALSSLDPLEAGRTMTTLSRLQKQVGLSVVFATSDGAEAMAQAERIAVMAGGRLVQIGRPDELYDRPEHAMTARMTGPVNLLPGEATARGIRLDGAGDIAVPGSVASGAPAALAVRPDRIELHLVAPQTQALEGHVERIAFSALGLTAHVRLQGQGERLAARVDTRRLDSADLPEGRRVWCTWDEGAARLVRV